MTDPGIRHERTRHGPRTIALLGGALVLLGLLGFAAPLLTDLLGAVWQRDLEAQLERMAGLQRWRGMEAGVGGRTVTATVTAELRPTQARRTHPRGRDLGSGAALCRIEIPAIDLSAVVVSGVEPEHLAKGPGHYPGTAVPGGPGNVCIAGHRVTFGHPFGRLDELEPGDSITLEVSGLPYEYRVDEVYAVPREDNSPLRATEGDVLTLTTCHPPHSSRERLIVRALRIPADPVDEWLMGA